MTEYSLSICIPSKRNLIDSKSSISSAIGFCDSTGAELVISDNSGNKEKIRNVEKNTFTFHEIS